MRRGYSEEEETEEYTLPLTLKTKKVSRSPTSPMPTSPLPATATNGT